jgi:hypothetical protein
MKVHTHRSRSCNVYILWWVSERLLCKMDDDWVKLPALPHKNTRENSSARKVPQINYRQSGLHCTAVHETS